MYHITYDGKDETFFDLCVATRPSIPAPQKRGELVTIGGRDGALLITDGTYEPIEINIELNYVKRSADQMGEGFRTAKSWIKSPEVGTGALRVSDDPDIFYKVIAASVTEHSRRAKRGADLIATFVCEPYTYLTEGLYDINPGPIMNQYALAKPTYKITGEGVATLTVNGNELTANVGQNMTINTNLMVAYRDDGTIETQNTEGADYEDLYLLPGSNTVSISSGFTLKIQPNWRVL